MADNDEKLAQFQSITGCDAERAQFYLESAGYALDLAMASFYEGDGEGEGGDVGAGVPEPTPQAPVSRPPASQGKINIGTMDVSDSDSEEEGQAHYAGGSSTSGNVILGPKKKKFNVGDVFKAARDAGAEEVAPGTPGGAGGSGGARAFQGGGFKLGSDTVASAAVGVPAGAEAKPEERHFVLKMWRDGFSIDGGELRHYSDPGSREFMASVMRGSIPAELVKEAKGGEVHVDMEDHREEEFVREKVASKPFQGSGNVLGSIAPAVAPPAADASLDPKQAEAAAQAAAKVDSSKPLASIQVRLADGSRLVVKLNHSHTVANLRTYIINARPQYSGTAFSLLTTFPNKELTEEGQTLSEAGLVGAAVLQRLK